MAYKVIITPPAKKRLDMYIGYTINVLKNRQAAKAIKNDAKNTKKRLSLVADNLALCKDAVLAKYGYHKIQFEKHSFFMIYRIDGNMVVVDGMYHELQDYETLFIRQMHLK